MSLVDHAGTRTLGTTKPNNHASTDATTDDGTAELTDRRSHAA